MPADYLAPLGARTSAGTVVTKSRFNIMGPVPSYGVFIMGILENY